MKPIDPNEVGRILIIKPDHVGDMMLALPALVRIRRFFPEAAIDLLGDPLVHSFTLSCKLIDQVIPFIPSWPSRLMPSPFEWPGLWKQILHLRKNRYDLVINLRYDFRDIVLARSTGKRWVLTYDYKNLAKNVSHNAGTPPEGQHESERWTRLVEEARILPKDTAFRPPVTDESVTKVRGLLSDIPAGQPVVAVHFASRKKQKDWPEELCADLMQRIGSGLSATCVLVGSDKDKKRYARIEKWAGDVPFVDVAGKLELFDLPALFACCQAFVGMDSGPAHMAAAMDVPAFVLYSGAHQPEMWRPLGENVTVFEGSEAFGEGSTGRVVMLLSDVLGGRGGGR